MIHLSRTHWLVVIIVVMFALLVARAWIPALVTMAVLSYLMVRWRSYD